MFIRFLALPWYEISDATWVSSMLSARCRSLSKKSAVMFSSKLMYSFSNPILDDRRGRDFVFGRNRQSNDLEICSRLVSLSALLMQYFRIETIINNDLIITYNVKIKMFRENASLCNNVIPPLLYGNKLVFELTNNKLQIGQVRYVWIFFIIFIHLTASCRIETAQHNFCEDSLIFTRTESDLNIPDSS